MATQVQIRRGTTAQHTTFTGAVGEITVDTDKDTVVVHDGSAAGGYPLLRENGSQNLVTTGNATAAALIPSSSTVPTNGVYLPAANTVGVATNGTGRLFIDSSGNVGVGIVNPSAFGKLAVLSTSGANALQLLTPGNTSGLYFNLNDAAQQQITTYNGGVSLITQGAQPIAFNTNNTERLRITSDGLVGVGTSAPETDLQVGNVSPGASSLAKGKIQINDGPVDPLAGGGLEFKTSDYGSGYGWRIVATVSSNNPIVFANRANSATWTERLRIDDQGRVGIGVTGPQAPLHSSKGGTLPTANGTETGIFQWNGVTGHTSSVAIVGGSAASSELYFGDGDDIDVGFIRYEHPNNALVFATNTQERARLTSSGQLLVGASTARANFDNSTASAQLQVEGTTADGSTAAIIRNSADTSPAALKLVKSRGAALGSNTVVAESDVVGAVHFQGSDGTEFVEAGRIEVVVDGAPGANDMPGRIVLSTTLNAAASPTEEWRITNDGVVCYNQPAPTSKNAAGTLTIAELKTGIVNYTGAAATLTLPTGTLSEGGFSGIYTNMTFEWSVINTGSGTCTIGGGTAHTITGAATVTAGASGRFASRRTAANTFVTYRLS